MGRVKVSVSTSNVLSFLGRLRKLPEILAGKEPRYARLRSIFWAVFAKEFFRVAQKSFRDRSHGRRDDYGNYWAPLKKKTIARKRKEHYRSGYDYRKVPPSPHPELANRDTEELLHAFFLGSISGGNYIPVENQAFKLIGNNISLGVDLDHAARVNRLRELFPNPDKMYRDAFSRTMELMADRIAQELRN